MGKRILCLLLTLTLVLGLLPSAGAAEQSTKASGTQQSVVYIPLDNRPFNDERVQLLAQSLNVNLIMPEEDLYSTKLDGQSLNQNGTQYGNREALLTWLKAQAETYDTFILSLDQLLSGGLMNSRCMTENQDLVFDDGTTMTEYEVIDYIQELSQDHTVYIIDSVLRLATSTCYAGFQLSHYYLFYAYGNVGRPVLSGKNLTVDNIVANYPYSADGTTLAYRAAGFSNHQINLLRSPLSQATALATTVEAKAYLSRQEPELTEEVDTFSGEDEAQVKEAGNSALSMYLKIRERKLRLLDYATRTLCGSSNVHYLLGVDDSSIGNNIQTNEISLLSSHLGKNDLVFSALDGLGQTALTKVFLSSHSTGSAKVSVTTFGDGYDQIQSFNCYTPNQILQDALSYFGETQVSQDPDVSVVVLTNSGTMSTKDIYKLVDLLNRNEANQLPTILIDLMQTADSNLNATLLGNCHMGMLLAYSGKNDLPNSIIMGLSQGLARYHALTISGFQTKATQTAFLENLTVSMVKKYAYMDSAFSTMYQEISDRGLDPSNLLTQNTTIEKLLTSKVQSAGQALLNNIASSNFITSLAPYTTGSITQAEVTACRFPWLRTMEIDCDVSMSYSTKSTSQTFHSYYLDGKDDTCFYPTDYLTRQEATKLIVAATDTPVTAGDCSNFTDVSDWAQPYVAAAQRLGYVNGYPNGNFGGTTIITRSEFITILANYVQKTGQTLSSSTKASFWDVPRNQTVQQCWYINNLYLLADAGIIRGFPDGSFGPTNQITRGEAVALICRVLGREESLDAALEQLPRFSDVDISNWCYSYIQEGSISHFVN